VQSKIMAGSLALPSSIMPPTSGVTTKMSTASAKCPLGGKSNQLIDTSCFRRFRIAPGAGVG
jgi:hypothetical protein